MTTRESIRNSFLKTIQYFWYKLESFNLFIYDNNNNNNNNI